MPAPTTDLRPPWLLLLEVVSPFDFGAVGILAAVTVPLAAAGPDLLLFTYETGSVLARMDTPPAVSATETATGNAIVE